MNDQILIYILCATLIIISLAFLIYMLSRNARLKKYIEAVTYNTKDARNSTLLNFPLPLAAFRISDSQIVWANDEFFAISGNKGSRLDAKISDFIQGFTGKWLMEGKTQYPSFVTANGKKYKVLGNIVRQQGDNNDSTTPYMGISYWVDVTDYDVVKTMYENSRPVVDVIVIDNLDELYKNQPDHIRNDISEAITDILTQWITSHNGLIRRYDRDRYLAIIEQKELELLKEEKFTIIEQIHKIDNPAGISASISMGFGENASTFAESIQFADMANELALTRGGDQAVVKNKLNFEFYGGRGTEVEKRTKVKSRVMANTLAELIKDSSKVFVMGHKFSDLDSIGAAVGICCMCRKFNVNAYIVVDEKNTAANTLIDIMKEDKEYRYRFLDLSDAMIKADGRTLLVVVDTNRPEQVEDAELLDLCNKVAVIDHHRVASTYIQDAALGFIEPYASSASELVTELLQENLEKKDFLKCEADALLAGITLDTKNFTIRTGERTFDVAAFLRAAGADTTDVKKLQQSNMDDTISKYRILQTAELYRNVAIAVPTSKQSRVVAAKAADELLNISGVEASIVIAPGANGVFASARSIGELNVQIIMEKLGGGGNRSAAAAQFSDLSLEEAVEKVYRAIDEYLG